MIRMKDRYVTNIGLTVRDDDKCLICGFISEGDASPLLDYHVWLMHDMSLTSDDDYWLWETRQRVIR